MKRAAIVVMAVLLLVSCGSDGPGRHEDERLDGTVEAAPILNDLDAPYDWTMGLVLRVVRDEDEYLTSLYVDLGNGPGPVVSNSQSYDWDEPAFERIDPGDVIAWSPDGDDFTVADDEIVVLQANAVGGRQ